MNFNFLFTILLLTSSCCVQSERPLSEKQSLANTIRATTATKIEHELAMIPIGWGGQMMHQIKMLNLSFRFPQPLDIETGRRLLVRAVQIFVQEINEEKQIHQYLAHYPATPETVEIKIFSFDSQEASFSPDSLFVVVADQGTLKYKINNPKTNKLEIVLTETYEEALTKVEQIKSSTFKVDDL